MKPFAGAPLVSVVIPTYNCARFLPQAIDSVLGQSYSRRELIVVDDGSTDDTDAVLRRYAGRIRIVQRPNGGVSSARNRGIRESRGEFVAFLDSDDIWHSDKLQRQLALFTRSAVGLVHCGLRYIDIDGNVVGVNRSGRRGHVLKDFALFRGTVVQGGGSGSIVRRPVFEAVGLFDPDLSRVVTKSRWCPSRCWITGSGPGQCTRTWISWNATCCTPSTRCSAIRTPSAFTDSAAARMRPCF
jgi:glycosyltransferase involved in cell wall biosynthesis